MTIFDWIATLGANATDCLVNQNCDFTETGNGGLNLLSAFLDGTFKIFQVPLSFAIDFVLAWVYVFQQLFSIILFLIAPLNCIIQFLIGIVQSWQTPQILNNAWVPDAGMITFLNAIPGFTYFELLLVAIFWFLVFRKTLETFKY